MEQIRADGSRRRVWGGRQELLPGAGAEPHVAADKGLIKRRQGGRAVAEEHDSSLLRPGNL